MVSVTMTTVAKEAGPRRPSTSRNEGWREAHPSSVCSFLEFSCQAVKYGPPLGSEHSGAIFGTKSPRLIRPYDTSKYIFFFVQARVSAAAVAPLTILILLLRSTKYVRNLTSRQYLPVCLLRCSTLHYFGRYLIPLQYEV